MGTIVHVTEGLGMWSVDCQPLVGDIVWEGRERFRVVSRNWIGGLLHVDVVRIVEGEDDEQVQVEADNG